MAYSDFIEHVRHGQVKEVTIQGREIQGCSETGERFSSFSPGTMAWWASCWTTRS